MRREESRSDQLAEQGIASFNRYRPARDKGHLHEARRLLRQSLSATPVDHPERARRLSVLGMTLDSLAPQGRVSDLLLEAVQAGRESVAAAPRGHPSHALCCSNLGISLMSLAGCTRDVGILREAVAVAREAVASTPLKHSNRVSYINNLSQNLERLYMRTGEVDALRESAQMIREAVSATPRGAPNRGMYCANLAVTLRKLAVDTGQVEILREAVEWGEEAVTVTPADHPDRSRRMANYALSLKNLAETTDDLATLQESIRLSKEALAARQPDDPGSAPQLTNLGESLRTMFERTGQIESLLEAVKVGREAARAARPDQPERGRWFSTLQISLSLLFKQNDDLTALVESVEMGREAVASTEPGDDNYARRLHNLGTVLTTLHGRTGDTAILLEAVRAGKDAVAATPSGHSAQAGHLNNLGVSLLSLYEETGDLDALHQAIATGREAIAACVEHSPGKAMYYANLGSALCHLAERTGDTDTSAEAVEMCREAVKITLPGDPYYAGRLTGLGNALRIEFELTGNLDVIREAVRVAREAAAATPEGHQDRGGQLSNLGVALHTVFKQTHDLEALDEAVRIGRDAVAATPPSDPEYPYRLFNLGAALQVTVEQTGDENLLPEAVGSYSKAALSPVAPIDVTIRARRGLGWAAMTSGDSAQALAEYEETVALLPRMSSRGLSSRDREHRIGEVAGLAAEAASAAISAGRPDRAVELLESTRGLLLTERMDARGDVSELQALAPALAEQLARLRDDLAVAERTDSGYPAQLVTDRRLRLMREWDALVAKIREIPELRDFLRAPPIGELREQAADGPIIMVNVSRYRCDVLVLTASREHPVRLIELPDLTREGIVRHVNRFLDATRAWSDSSADDWADREMREILEWLWDEIAAPVFRHLGLTEQQAPGAELPRIWWCPVGEAAFMPLHAAGYHADLGDGTSPRASGKRTVLDRAVSSYTPTIRALRYARESRTADAAAAASHDAADGALIIAMPQTPGNVQDLPGAQIEAERIARLVPGSVTLTGPAATSGTVLTALSRHRIVHLACHGVSDWNDPASSMLLLHDHSIRPLTVAAVSQLRLTHADLAYLSACETTVTSQNLADEAFHITAAFLLAGYRHVIGTLWPIGDALAIQVAGSVYAHLTGGGSVRPDAAQASLALHEVIRRVRDRDPARPFLWASYLHAGS